MVRHEGRDPHVGVLHNLLIHTVLIVLLHVSIEEEVETGDVGERYVLGEGSALFVTQGLEELVV